MRLIGLLLLMITGMTNVAFAQWTYDVSAGGRQDEVNFNFAGDENGQNPNVLSELKWTNLKIREIQLNGKNEINDKSFFEGSVGYGWIYSGHNQDSDYSGDNRTGMFSRSENNAGNGHVVDASLGYGYYINKQKKSKTALLAGYSVNKQSLTMTDGYQTYSGAIQPQPLGPYSGLNNTYNARWNGPYLGLAFEQKADERLNLFTRIEYHIFKSYGEGNWNLISGFAHPKSLEEISSGHGTVLVAGAEYKMPKDWVVKAKVSFSRFTAKKGLFREYYSDGTTGEARLNATNWNSRFVSVGITKYF